MLNIATKEGNVGGGGFKLKMFEISEIIFSWVKFLGCMCSCMERSGGGGASMGCLGVEKKVFFFLKKKKGFFKNF